MIKRSMLVKDKLYLLSVNEEVIIWSYVHGYVEENSRYFLVLLVYSICGCRSQDLINKKLKGRLKTHT